MGLFDETVWDYIGDSEKEAYEEYAEDPTMKAIAQKCSAIAPNLAEQTFYGLLDFCADPADEAPEGLELEHKMLKSAFELPEFEDLRYDCSNDPIASMLGVSGFLNEIIPMLPDDVKEKMEEHQKDQQEVQNLEDQMQQQEKKDKGNQNTSAMQQLQQQLAKAKQKSQQSLQNALDAMDGSQAQMTASAMKALKKGKEGIKDAKDTLEAFGAGSGQKPMTKEDLSSINKIRELFRNNKFLKRFADLIGSMKQIASREKKMSPFGKQQIVGYRRQELDVDSLVDEELLGLASPAGSALKKEFLIRAVGGELFHYEYEGKADSGKGPMIILKDTSGSMYGDKFRMASALEIALVQMAVSENRRCITIPFSDGPKGSGWDMFEVSQNPSIDEIVSNASVNYGGGTDPYPALSAAIDKILENQDFKKAGILIITDGEFWEPPMDFMDKLNDARKNPGVYISSIVIGAGYDNIKLFSDKVVPFDDFNFFDEGEQGGQIGDALKYII